MQGKTWIELLERIPEAYRDGLYVVTASGTEINLQTILRLEDEFMVFRGRLMGSTEAQRTFFLPYNQINVLIYQRLMKEEEVQAWFGGAPVPVVTVTEEKKEVPAETAETPEPAPPPPEPLPNLGRLESAPLPGKSAIMERLRKRNVPGTGNSAPGTTPLPPPK